MNYELGEVILERNFDTYDREQNAQSVKLCVGKPQPVPEMDIEQWYCPRQIVGLGDEKVRVSYGIDGLQALWHSLQSAETELEIAAQEAHRLMTWLDTSDLGLPKGDSIAKDAPDFETIFSEFLRREDGRE